VDERTSFAQAVFEDAESSKASLLARHGSEAEAEATYDRKANAMAQEAHEQHTHTRRCDAVDDDRLAVKHKRLQHQGHVCDVVLHRKHEPRPRCKTNFSP